MAKRTKKRAKKRTKQMPPLSLLDKLIYGIILLLLIVLYFSPLLLSFALRNKIAFFDATVIAAHEHSSSLWSIAPCLILLIITGSLWSNFYINRKPIFGLKNFKYGPPKWPKVYPLFSKEKHTEWISEKKKKTKKQIAIILIILLLISFIPFPLSLYGRDCLRYDGSILEYNMFNVQTLEIASNEITDIQIETYRYFHGRRSITRHYGVRIILRTDNGSQYYFDFSDFRKGEASSRLYWLDEMLNIKQLFDPRIIRYGKTDYIDDVISDKELTQEEAEKLYQLFEH